MTRAGGLLSMLCSFFDHRGCSTCTQAKTRDRASIGGLRSRKRFHATVTLRVRSNNKEGSFKNSFGYLRLRYVYSGGVACCLKTQILASLPEVASVLPVRGARQLITIGCSGTHGRCATNKRNQCTTERAGGVVQQRRRRRILTRGPFGRTCRRSKRAQKCNVRTRHIRPAQFASARLVEAAAERSRSGFSFAISHAGLGLRAGAVHARSTAAVAIGVHIRSIFVCGVQKQPRSGGGGALLAAADCERGSAAHDGKSSLGASGINRVQECSR